MSRLTCQLWCSGAHQRNKTSSINDASAGMQSLCSIGWILPHGEDCVFAAPPDTFKVDRHRQVPDLLVGVERVVVSWMHYSWYMIIS
jgi:hypothetical protein